MKLKFIKQEKDLNPGLHIRAFVNYVGEHYVYVVNVKGKPFTDKSHKEKLRKVMIDQGGWSRDTYLSDLGLRGYDVGVVPFTNKAFDYLNSLGARELFSVLRGTPFSDEEWSEQEWDFVFNRDMDRMHRRMYYED